MMLATLISLIYKDGVTLNLFLASLSTLLLGGVAMYGTKNHSKEMNKREGSRNFLEIGDCLIKFTNLHQCQFR